MRRTVTGRREYFSVALAYVKHWSCDMHSPSVGKKRIGDPDIRVAIVRRLRAQWNASRANGWSAIDRKVFAGKMLLNKCEKMGIGRACIPRC